MVCTIGAFKCVLAGDRDERFALVTLWVKIDPDLLNFAVSNVVDGGKAEGAILPFAGVVFKHPETTPAQSGVEVVYRPRYGINKTVGVAADVLRKSLRPGEYDRVFHHLHTLTVKVTDCLNLCR